jgi:hypothetical protein
MIGIPVEVQAQFQPMEVDQNIVPDLISSDLSTRETARLVLKKGFKSDERGLLMLQYMLSSLAYTYDNYRKMGIDTAVFTATMGCFTRFLKEHKNKYGFYAFDRDWWVTRQMAMVLFRIGELEYEFVSIRGEPVISIHIPSDAQLTPEKCGQSYREAKKFIKTYFGEMIARPYVCESWLLSPALPELLPPEANIIKFQQQFEILEWKKENKDFMAWIFPVPPDTPMAQLPEQTGLQKKVKEWLFAGGQIGSAYGRL